MYTINITMTTNQLLSGMILHVFLGDLCRVFRPYAQKRKKSNPKNWWLNHQTWWFHEMRMRFSCGFVTYLPGIKHGWKIPGSMIFAVHSWP